MPCSVGPALCLAEHRSLRFQDNPRILRGGVRRSGKWWNREEIESEKSKLSRWLRIVRTPCLYPGRNEPATVKVSGHCSAVCPRTFFPGTRVQFFKYPPLQKPTQSPAPGGDEGERQRSTLIEVHVREAEHIRHTLKARVRDCLGCAAQRPFFHELRGFIRA